MLVHFPIVLLLGSFACDAAGWALRRDWLHRAGLVSLAIGVIGTAAAVVTGFVTPEAGEVGIGFHSNGGLQGFFSGNRVDVHQNLALLLMAATVLWFIVRLVLWGRSATWRRAYLSFGLVIVALVVLTGYYGGEIVYGPKVTISHLSDTQFQKGN
jgi:uncharacterized membrane protein